MGKNGQQGDIHIRLTAGDEASPVILKAAQAEQEMGRAAEVAGQKMAQASDKAVRGAREMTRAQAVAARERVREYERVLRSQEYRRAELIPSVVRPSAPRPSIARAEWYDVSPRPLQGGQRGRDAVRAAVIERNAAEMARLAPLTEYATAESMRTQQYAMYGGKAEASAELHRRQAEQEARRQREADITQAFSDREEAQKANATWMRPGRNTNADLQEQQVAELVSARKKYELETDMEIAEQEHQANRRSYAEKERNAEKQIAWKKRYYDESMRAIAAENKITGAVKEQEAAFGRLNRAKGGGFFKGGWDQAMSHIGAMGIMYGGIRAASTSLESRREALDKQYAFEDQMTPLLSMGTNAEKAPEMKRDVLESSVVNRSDPQEIVDLKFKMDSAKAYIANAEVAQIEQQALLAKRVTGTPLGVSADAMTTTWAAYRDQLGSVDKMAGKLKITADMGKMRPEDLAALLPDVISGAKATGQNIDDVLAASISATNAGGSNEKTFTGQRTFYARLIEAQKKGFSTKGMGFLQILQAINQLPPEKKVELFGQEGISFAEAVSRNPEQFAINKRAVQGVTGKEMQKIDDARMRDPQYRQMMNITMARQMSENAPMMGWRAEGVSEFDKRQEYAKAGWRQTMPLSMQWMGGSVGFLEASAVSFFEALASKKLGGKGTKLEDLPIDQQAKYSPWASVYKQEAQMIAYSQGKPEEAKLVGMSDAQQQKYFDEKALDTSIAEGQAKLDLMAQEALTQSNGDLRGSVDNLRGAVDANTAAMAIGDLAAGREPTTVQGMRSAKQDREATLEMNRRDNEAYWKSQERIRNRREGVKVEGSFAVGTKRVPKDMVAKIHKDEAIIPAAQNPYANESVSDMMQRFGGKLSPDQITQFQRDWRREGNSAEAMMYRFGGKLSAEQIMRFRKSWKEMGSKSEDQDQDKPSSEEYGTSNPGYRDYSFSLSAPEGGLSNFALNQQSALYGNANSRAWGGANGPMSNSGVWNSGGVGFAQMGGGSGTIPGIDELIGGVRELNGNIVSLGRRMDALGGKMERGNVSPRVPQPVSRGAMRGE